jgi:limonene-1,2-epoxide hydrolase
MFEQFHELAHQGITRMENELLVRDFMEMVSLGEPTALEPFLHRDVKFSGSAGAQAVGKGSVIRLCQLFTQAFFAFELKVVTIASVGDTVLVEQTAHVRVDEQCHRHALMGFAALDVVDFQIVSWRQLFG